MGQFKEPLKLQPFFYEEHIHEADTAKTKAAPKIEVKAVSISEVNHTRKRGFTVNDLAMIVFIIAIGLMSIYTFFIICVDLFKIFTQIVLR